MPKIQALESVIRSTMVEVDSKTLARLKSKHWVTKVSAKYKIVDMVNKARQDSSNSTTYEKTDYCHEGELLFTI